MSMPRGFGTRRQRGRLGAREKHKHRAPAGRQPLQNLFTDSTYVLIFTDPSDVCKWGKAVRSCVEKWWLCFQPQHPFLEDQVIPRAATKASALVSNAQSWAVLLHKLENRDHLFVFVCFVCLLATCMQDLYHQGLSLSATRQGGAES